MNFSLFSFLMQPTIDVMENVTRYLFFESVQNYDHSFQEFVFLSLAFSNWSYPNPKLSEHLRISSELKINIAHSHKSALLTSFANIFSFNPLPDETVFAFYDGCVSYAKNMNSRNKAGPE